MIRRRLTPEGIFTRLEPKLVQEIAARGTHDAALRGACRSFCKNLHSEVAPFVESPRGRLVLRTALSDWLYLTYEPVNESEQVSRKQVIAVARIQLRNFDEVIRGRRLAARLAGPRALEAKQDLPKLADARNFIVGIMNTARKAPTDSKELAALHKTYARLRESTYDHLLGTRIFHHQLPESVSKSVAIVLSKYRLDLPENMLAGETLGKMKRAGKGK